MYNPYKRCQCHYCLCMAMCKPYKMYSMCNPYRCNCCINIPYDNICFPKQFIKQCYPFTNQLDFVSEEDFLNPTQNNLFIELKDYGPNPYVVDIDAATKQNNTFRTALWTGENLQVTLMSIEPGEEIGLETHPNIDQFIRIEEGQGLVKIGDRKDKLEFEREIFDDYAIMIPAGKWHNIINTGNEPLKLYSIYAPPEHPRGTVHETKAIAEAAEKKYGPFI